MSKMEKYFYENSSNKQAIKMTHKLFFIIFKSDVLFFGYPSLVILYLSYLWNHIY